MNPLKKLAGQTAVYGLPTIVGRLLNYFLTPLYTYNFVAAEYGVVTFAYGYVTFLLVFLTYGLETTLFRFSQTHPDKKDSIFSTALISVFTTSSLFFIACSLFAIPISDLAKFNNHPEYVVWFSAIISIDALCAIAYAKLREMGKAKKFAFVRTTNIAVNIGLNLFFIAFCKTISEQNEGTLKSLVDMIYNPTIGIGYIFISNLIASILSLLMLATEIFSAKILFVFSLWKNMMKYSIPLLFAGLAGMINETLDRVILPYFLPENIAMSQTGIYGACYKVSIIMTLFVTTFRYAAEPFLFSHSKESNFKELYATITKFFVAICAIIFLGTMMNMRWIQYFAGKEEFRTGIKVVPILLLANLFLGIYFVQSFWYKLSGQTKYGAYLTLFGAVITIVLNIILIPKIGYMGSAWATLICYAAMAISSYVLGNKHYPVNYDVKRILAYLTLSLLLYLLVENTHIENIVTDMILKNSMLLFFIAIVFYFEKDELKKIRKGIV